MDNCTINGYLALIACIFGRSTPEQALHDYCAAARKITPEYQQEAFYACAAAVLQEMNTNRTN